MCRLPVASARSVKACAALLAPVVSRWSMPPVHFARANVNGFMFGSGAARRNVAELTPSGPQAQEIIPGGRSGVFLSPLYTNQLRLWLVNDYLPLTIGEGAAQSGAAQVRPSRRSKHAAVQNRGKGDLAPAYSMRALSFRLEKRNWPFRDTK
jgi:hypothetical protein